MTRVAAVDVGTNSVRLLVAEDVVPLRVLDRRNRITRLGKGVDAAGRLDDEALARTLACLDDYAGRWRELGAQRVRISATSAVRDAADRDRFFDGTRERTGIEAEVLSGDEEARLSFLGATALLTAPAPYVVLDIGGGSTEFIRGTTGPQAMTSRQLGAVRLTERALHSDPPTPGEVEAARAFVDVELAAAEALVDTASAATLIGVAGTITTVAALALDLVEYRPGSVHGAGIPAARVAEVTGRLLGLTTAQRGQLGAIAAGREDVIHGGAMILDRVLRRCGFSEILVSESDILDGLVLDLLGEGQAVR